MPLQSPPPSIQTYETPWSLIRAVERRFGRLAWDLAASDGNAKAGRFFTEEDDSLKQVWHACQGNRWCNPPFKRGEPWVKKAWDEEVTYREMEFMATGDNQPREEDLTIMLMLASVGSNWFSEYVHKKALVLPLNPRVTFEGQEDPYTKDVMLIVYGVEPGFDVWKGWDQ